MIFIVFYIPIQNVFASVFHSFSHWFNRKYLISVDLRNLNILILIQIVSTVSKYDAAVNYITMYYVRGIID